jgi:Ca2+:H+ antiporter
LILKWMLLFVPAAIAVRYIPALDNDIALFIVSAVAIVPLSGWIGIATQRLAHHTGQGLGGLLNVTFGNAAELLISIIALANGLSSIVKASITGSIIGNTLLVVGCSAFAGGITRRHQQFNARALRASATTLLLATVGLCIPTVFHSAAGKRGAWTAASEQHLSLAIAAILLLAYAAMLIFSLKTHADLFAGKEQHRPPEKTWSVLKCVAVLLVATAGAAFMSEFLVSTIESARRRFGFSEIFTGVVIVAIVGNAAEHSTAIMAAVRDKMDLALGIGIGSSLQIALFVAPVLLFVSYLFPAPISFEFTVPEIFAVTAAVLIVAQISGDGESNWLEGALLLAVYAILAVLFFFLPAPDRSAIAAG